MTTIPSPADIHARDNAATAKRMREFVIEHGTNILGGKPQLFYAHHTQVDEAVSMFHAAGWKCEKESTCGITVSGKLLKE